VLEMNGRARRALASQIDRLDAVLDGRSAGLNEVVAAAVREGVGLAAHEAVRAVLAEVLTNPALREQLQKAAAAKVPPPDEPKRPPRGGGKGRPALLGGRVRHTLRSACRAGAEFLRQAAQAASLAWRLAGARGPAPCCRRPPPHWPAPPWSTRARRLCGGARSLADRAWGAFRRALAALGLGGA
jgi:hypothetical protein